MSFTDWVMEAMLFIIPSITGLKDCNEVFAICVTVSPIRACRLFDLPDEYLEGYLSFCKPIARAIQKAFGYNRVNIITIGFEVPHAHIHLVPMNGMRDADILTHKIKLSMEELKKVQEQILEELGE